jgi:hypothetical protein
MNGDKPDSQTHVTPDVYAAYVHGPNGLKIDMHGPADVVAAQLRSAADAISPKPAATVHYRGDRRGSVADAGVPATELL